MEIKISNLSKSFGDNAVLKGINLETRSGKALGILGRNGAGKTTAIRIIMGVFPSDTGEILLDGKPINYNNVKIGYLPEERGLYPKKKIMEQMIYFGNLRGMSKKEAIISGNHWLSKLGMTEYSNRRLDTLSKGNQQKIQLAITLISNPDIIILDEPFSGLDPVNAILLKDIVKELIIDDKIVLFSSHQMNYIEEFCENIAILNGGEIVLAGSIKEIKKTYPRNKIIIASNEIVKIKNKLNEDCKIENGHLVVTLKSEADKGKLLMKLAELTIDLDSITVYEPSLSDIFVEYTEGRI